MDNNQFNLCCCSVNRFFAFSLSLQFELVQRVEKDVVSWFCVCFYIDFAVAGATEQNSYIAHNTATPYQSNCQFFICFFCTYILTIWLFRCPFVEWNYVNSYQNTFTHAAHHTYTCYWRSISQNRQSRCANVGCFDICLAICTAPTQTQTQLSMYTNNKYIYVVCRKKRENNSKCLWFC